LSSETTTAPAVRKSFRFSRRQAIALVACCTIFGAAGQMLIKTGAGTLASSSPLAMVTNFHLMVGYGLYGISAALLVLALRDGELSILYPVISLTYVWVTFLSLLIFKETLNPFKVLGVSLIVFGVAILGRNGKGPA